MLNDEVGVPRIDAEEFARGKLVIQPVDGAILQVRERIVTRRAGQLVFAQDRLLLPGIRLVGWPARWLIADPVAALHCLPSIPPGRYTPGIYHLTLDVKSSNQEAVALIFQVLKYRTRILPHQDRVRRIVVNAELIAYRMFLADAVQGYPWARRIGDVVVPAVGDTPAGHRALLDAERKASRLGLL